MQQNYNSVDEESSLLSTPAASNAPAAPEARSNSSIAKLTVAAVSALLLLGLGAVYTKAPAMMTMTDLKVGDRAIINSGGWTNAKDIFGSHSMPTDGNNIVLFGTWVRNAFPSCIQWQNQALSGFQMILTEGVKRGTFAFNCVGALADNVVSERGEYGTTWHQQTGGIEYLDRQRVFCPRGQYLAKWNFNIANGGGLNIEYECVKYKNDEGYICEDKFTNWNDRGWGIIYLDRHRVDCPAGTGLGGWEGITNQKLSSDPVPNPIPHWYTKKDGSFAIHYTCCSSKVAPPPTMEPTGPTLAPTEDPAYWKKKCSPSEMRSRVPPKNCIPN